MISDSALGIFDSGIGGLTVARAVKNALPNEQIIYFGDTEHLPYGDKSASAIQAFSIKISDFLLKQKAKVILIACNSASVAAYDLLKEYVKDQALIVNVIDPMVDYVSQHFAEKEVGMIGTRQTVDSEVYQNKIKSKMSGKQLRALATPLLVPMIEEGFVFNNISNDIISEYLNSPELSNIDALLLACTHYPLIEKEIREYYNSKVEVVNSADLVAEHLKSLLAKHQLLNSSKIADDVFYVSDYTESFEKSTKLFFGEEVELKKHRLWST